jgi:hypothetical protein
MQGHTAEARQDVYVMKPLESEHFQCMARRYYGRCKACRKRRKRERYHSTSDIQAVEIAIAWRNKLRRAGRTLG